MENVKNKSNHIINAIVVCLTLCIIAMLIALSFFNPYTQVKALTKEDIRSANIYFVSSLTSLRSSNSLNLNSLVGYDSNTRYNFSEYQYNYCDYPELYYTNSNQSLSSTNNSLVLESAFESGNPSREVLYTSVSTNDKLGAIYDTLGFIPYGATHYKNFNDEINSIFYNEFDEGDFVLLNNYDNFNYNKFHVENLYLGFGSPYIDELTTTPLASLRVEGTLEENDKTHYLALNKPLNAPLENGSTTGKQAYYWHQYFDMRSLLAYETNDVNAPTYAVKNAQGKYTITFHFIKYDDNLSAENSPEETFTFSFFLLDSAKYSDYPTISNASIKTENDQKTIASGRSLEYFYNFTTDAPVLTYNPKTFNIAYSRMNNKSVNNVETTIQSSFKEGSYSYRGQNFPKGIITYYNGSSIAKQVFILTHYNDDKSVVEQLFLSRTNPTDTNFNPISYDAFVNNLDNDMLDFEYKITSVLSVSNDKTTFTTNTYRTTTYTNYPLIADKLVSVDGLVATLNDSTTLSFDKIESDMFSSYTINGSKIATADCEIGIQNLQQNTIPFATLNTAEGIFVDNATLTTTATELTVNNARYTLVKETTSNTYNLVREYKTSSDTTETSTEIICSISLDTIQTAQDFSYQPVGSNITYTIKVNVADSVATIESVTFKIKTNLKINSATSTVTQNTLYDIIGIDQKELSLDYTYELVLDELGIYDFVYSYVCCAGGNNTYYINSTATPDSTFSYSNSANKNSPSDFSAEKTIVVTNNDGSIPAETKNVYAVISSPIINTQAVLLGDTYTYIVGDEFVTQNGSNTKHLDASYELGDSHRLFVKYQVETISKVLYLRAYIKLGTVSKNLVQTTTTTHSINGYNINSLTQQQYTIGYSVVTPDALTSEMQSKADYEGLVNIITKLNNTSPYEIISTSSQKALECQPKMHIFGSIAYFSKPNAYSDSNYSKLQQKDAKLQLDYISDVTSTYLKANGSYLASSLSPSEVNANTFKGNIAPTMLYEDIIITDVTPVLWNNFSTLYYTNNNKKSMSYVYRYTKYSVDANGYVQPNMDYCVTSTYTKDIYCHYSGLYEVVVFYTYNNLPLNTSNNNIYYQVFTFIIDNSSPELDIQVFNPDTSAYEDLGLNAYTNKDVRLRWQVPTYFQNDVYIEIKRNYFTSNTSENFVATYQGGNITSTAGLGTEGVKAISAMGTIQINNANYYYVDLKKQSPTTTYTLNGNYEIIVHYSYRGKSTFSEKFIIDKMDISGLNIKSIVKNTNGSYELSKTNIFANNQQIVNNDFTFRFDKKLSNANIFVYYDKIELTTNSNFDQLVNTSAGETGVTTKFAVDGQSSNIAVGTPYTYNYTHINNPNHVESHNVLSSNTSCIYLFRLEDEAGNTARFVVFYDTTNPRIITSPSITDSSRIVSDTARAYWGDYKAIPINTDNGFELSDEGVTNYSKETDTNELSLVLRYMNNSSNSKSFNNLKVEEVNDTYYILLPLSNFHLIDNARSSASKDIDQTTSETSGQFYFFPVNPITTINSVDYVSLPTYDNNGKVIMVNNEIQKTNYEIVSYAYEKVLNSYNESIDRFVTITYYVDKESSLTKTITGAIGTGTFYYEITDHLNNKFSSKIKISFDKTEMAGFALFDYSGKLESSIELTEDQSYASSQLFISSKISTADNKIPEYNITYKHYPYNPSIYNDYNILSAELLSDEQGSLKTYIRLNLSLKTDSTITKEIDVPITDEYGCRYPQYSYPYSLEGNAIVADTNGQPKDVYSIGQQTNKNDTGYAYSLAINTTTDTNKQKLVTEEGLYIFKREYIDKDLDSTTLGMDKMTHYVCFIVDRSGIINISSIGNSAINTLYNIGKDIEFTLGSNYNIANYQREISAQTIQNNQSAVDTTTSNANYKSQNLFDTNKIQVEFNMTYDKHNFDESIDSFKQQIFSKVDNANTELTNTLNNYIFQSNHFINQYYKLDLLLKVGENSVIIDEYNRYYSTPGISAYLKNNPMVTPTMRGNSYDFFLDVASNNYIIGINDHAGYDKFNAEGSLESNCCSNQLQITFDITHTAPEGELFGKYYGRHDYDENQSNSDKPLNIPSIPFQDGAYQILKYMESGQLDPLSDSTKHVVSSMDGNNVKLYSTNNETLIFTFFITEDEYEAQIDPNNIKIYKGGTSSDKLIFNRTNGNFVDTMVDINRQSNAFIKNIVNGVTYYAIIIFDNNLDDIVDKGEEEYLTYRLLDPKDNPDKETYYISLQYVGNSADYIGQDVNANPISFYKTTYEIDIDRIKPTYNLTKLMAQDKYVYTNITTPLTTENFESQFEKYKPFYNFYTDEAQEFERSDLENYFFAIDTRPETSFVFESINEKDNNNTFYIRQVDKNNYKFSVTPDDYTAYYNATYLQGHPQFTPSSAITITNETFTGITPQNYYKIQFSLDGDDSDGISANFLKNYSILHENCYYEIIEEDEAGNYRVYGIYVPQESADTIVYTYQTNSSVDSTTKITIMNVNPPPYVSSNGMALTFTSIQTTDNFLKALINVKTDKLTHNIEVYLDPVKMEVRAFNRTLNSLILTYELEQIDKNNYVNTDEFIQALNYILDDYYAKINDKTHNYYSEYGYNVKIEIVNRIGVSVKDTTKLYNYEIAYNVAGSTLSPIFKDYSNYFTMTLEGQKGSTYLTDITVSKFNNGWAFINTDNSTTPQIFDKTAEALKEPIVYRFNRGVYKFVFTDNFNRVNEFFYEFGISSSPTGGYLTFSGNTSTSGGDGYTYSSNAITYTYDSSVYNVYIKFVGKVPNEANEGEYDNITSSQNYIVFNSSQPSNDTESLKKYGIVVITSGTTTTITFNGVKDNSKTTGITDLSKYHIKTILASTSTNYTWGLELTNKDIFVYNKQIALYTAIPEVKIKNLSGNTLDTTDHLNLTEDFELTISWPSHVNDRIDFNPRIILTRTYNVNGIINSETTQVLPGSIIKQPGDYSAYVVNSLGTRSKVISFTRGEGEISMYAVYSVNSQESYETKLSPSSMVGTEQIDESNKVLFTYFVKDEYFNYKNATTGDTIGILELYDYIEDSEIALTEFVVNTNASKYVDVRVNSNLSIRAEVYAVGFENYDNFSYPFVKYQIYSTTKNDEKYVYRFIQIVYVSSSDNHLADAYITNEGSSENLAIETIKDKNGNTTDVKIGLITSTSPSMTVNFTFGNEFGIYVPYGDTLYLDRYYNNYYIETYIIEVDSVAIPTFNLKLNQVGLHEFMLRDLAGRYHDFADGSDTLQIYLINEILYTINDQQPINNQIFNSPVTMNIVFQLEGLQLYNERSLNIVVTKNGQSSTIPNSNGEFTISDAGYYSVKITAMTQFNEGSATQVSSIYNFVIINTEIATSTFSVSKGTGFSLEKLYKIVNGEKTDITNSYSLSTNINNASNTLLWLSHQEQGNSIFEVTLRYYHNVTDTVSTFTFSVWINNEVPVILTSIPAGTSSKETIVINFNPGIIYNQIGKGYITLNEKIISNVDETSSQYVDTINISEAGTYWLRIYTDDGVLISAYKFTKTEPMNGIAKTILICVAIGAVLLVGLFFFLRRKGKYR